MYQATEVTPTFEFPKLMRNTTAGEIVLFEESGKGTVIVTSDPSRAARQLTGVTMGGYEDVTETIEIQNTPV